MREMGAAADVPIEPRSQTALLDACVGTAGVIGGGVPGAGGFDAVWLLACAPAGCAPEELPAARVERVWGTHRVALDGADGEGKEEGKAKEGEKEGEGEEHKAGGGVSPLLAEESVEGGLRVETVEGVRGLKEVLAELAAEA